MEQMKYNGEKNDSTNGTGITGRTHAKKKEKEKKDIDTDVTPFRNINLKWIVELNIK